MLMSCMYNARRFAEAHRARLDVVSLVAPDGGQRCLLMSRVGEECQAGAGWSRLGGNENSRRFPDPSDHRGCSDVRAQRSKLNGRTRTRTTADPKQVVSAGRLSKRRAAGHLKSQD
ncbi:hypothetical protein DHEL01_v209030 [Diaporthe helianthi]|uniref:Uncharacterized protein n=1 Tax=Diaporthe helianthi TaxID=158607 RepID=A0A2P5HQN0_DIAHE|nr:hypothetical protein DHEL01_v209030 [Diaporthe helianthi]